MAEGRVVYITEVPKANEVRLFENEPDVMKAQQVAEDVNKRQHQYYITSVLGKQVSKRNFSSPYM